MFQRSLPYFGNYNLSSYVDRTNAENLQRETKPSFHLLTIDGERVPPDQSSQIIESKPKWGGDGALKLAEDAVTAWAIGRSRRVSKVKLSNCRLATFVHTQIVFSRIAP